MIVTLMLGRVVRGWNGLLRELTDPYRPELHYMRGPGPKCREKRGDIGQG